MTILVTGGAGYIGGHMTLGLVDSGADVVVIDDLSTGFAWAVRPPARLIVGDVGDAELVARVIRDFKVSAIAHFAARLIVPESFRDPLGYYLTNTAKARTLIGCAIQSGVRRSVFSSTAAVYGECGCEPICETSPVNPISPYGRSKLAVEWMLRDVAGANDLRYVILRYFNVAGADPNGRLGPSGPDATHLIRAGVQTALGLRPSIEIYGDDYPTRDGTCERDYIQVTDLIDAHLGALSYLRAGGESQIFNCGYGRGATVKEVLETIRRVSRVDFEIAVGPRRAGDSMSVIAQADRARDLLGWRPRRQELEEIVRQSFDWERRLLAGRARGAARAAV